MGSLGGWEILIIVGVLVLLFGAKRLPDMARSLGQSARVLKGEMKGLKDEPHPGATTVATTAPPTPATAPPPTAEPAPLPPAVAGTTTPVEPRPHPDLVAQERPAPSTPVGPAGSGSTAQ